MRLHRPYIPLDVRAEVVWRMLVERDMATLTSSPMKGNLARWIDAQLFRIFRGSTCHLDHDPALVNRRRYVRNGKTFYDPPANDPKFLIYREGHRPGDGSEHDIKTRVRGEGAKLSDLAQARKAKRVAKNRKRGRGAAPVLQSRRSIAGSLRSRSVWPKGRKVQWWKREERV